ncbi:uncharacterized protein TM35_000441070 [Trypanosoma theileri]|uniref:Uncharacterized protein n=1 Tax=Trypanosoma theileri TaxID=67003 RepID=A0A1X0NIN4_9TRYP|nr:uncharacterized protein TM35_000441070 [Trypanosoma theileri]ORC84451.1 hypothetical protein TM35_000441070 [Trypanosoma theileri]
MTTMFVQLRRMVYLLVLLQCCVGVCTGKEAGRQPTGECLNKRDIEMGEKMLRAIIDPSAKAFGGAQDCLAIWRADVEACNENFKEVEYAVNTTREVFVMVGLEKENGVEAVTSSLERCNDQKVKSYAANLTEMVKVVNGAIKKMPELYKKTSEKAAVCVAFKSEMDHVVKRLTDARAGYFAIINDKDSNDCMTEDRLRYIGDLNKTYDGMKAVSDDLKKVQGNTHVCKLNSLGESPNYMKRIVELKGRCEDVFSKEEKVEAKPKMRSDAMERVYMNGTAADAGEEAKRGDEDPDEVKAPGAFQRVKKEVINRVLGEMEVAKQKRIAEKRRADEENAKRIAQEKEKRDAEEKAKREKEKQERMEAEKAKKVREEQERMEAEKARKAREDRERLAIEKTIQKTEKKTNQKKDGCNPVLVHSPLLLLLVLMSVLIIVPMTQLHS